MPRYIAMLSVLMLAGLTPSVAHASAETPPDLAALEQQMAQLQANSERFSFQEELSFGEGLLGKGIPLDLIVAGRGEASDSPPQASGEAGLFGLAAEPVRVIGETTYRYERSAAHVDGGRPWVRSHTKKTAGNPLEPSGLAGGQGGRQGTFTKLIEQLDGALSIEESGPVTVDDQRVTEFDASLDPTPLLAELQARSKAKTPQRPLNSLLHIPSVGGSSHTGKPEPAPTLELELFIAPNGLPVRTRETLSVEGATIAVRIDTLAINVPVHVTPPPAAQTIDEAQLKRIERRDAARARAHLLRLCRRLHGKRARSCRAAANAKPRLQSQSGSESSSPLL
jgi:hypothetical protein